MVKGLTYNIKVIGSKPHVIVFKILFLRVCALCDVAVSLILGGGDVIMNPICIVGKWAETIRLTGQNKPGQIGPFLFGLAFG